MGSLIAVFSGRELGHVAGMPVNIGASLSKANHQRQFLIIAII
ncbi:hypothetical protein [Thalassospira indica]|nr:hypothetical protein [Thalassospira indica]